MPDGLHSATLDARRAHMFPALAPAEIDRLRRFGAARRYASGERLLETGKLGPGMLVVLSGTLRITGRDGHGHDGLIANAPGVYAIGDARAGSVKRVGGAIGEGAAVVAQIHAFLRDRAEPARIARHG